MFSYCPHCAGTDFSFERQHRFICHRCQFEYFHNAAAAVAGLISCNGELLFVTRAKAPCAGMLDLPGGFVDPGESALDALTREISEELNIIVEDWVFFMSAPNQYHYNKVTYPTCDLIFHTALTTRPVLSCADQEIADVQWLACSKEVLDNIAFPSLRLAVKKFWSV